MAAATEAAAAAVEGVKPKESKERALEKAMHALLCRHLHGLRSRAASSRPVHVSNLLRHGNCSYTHAHATTNLREVLRTGVVEGAFEYRCRGGRGRRMKAR